MKEPQEVLEARAVIAQYEAGKHGGRLCANCGHKWEVHFSQGCKDGWCEQNCHQFIAPEGRTDE